MSRTALNVVLYVVAMVATALLVVAAVRVVDDEPSPELPVEGLVEMKEAPEAEQQRYADIIDAATEQATAFINIRYDDAQASIDKVLEGATGAFKEQYEQSTEALVKLLQENESIRTGEVLWTGVVAQDPDSATVIIATNGTVQNKQTGGQPRAEIYQLQLELVLEEDRWLTSDLQFVS